MLCFGSGLVPGYLAYTTGLSAAEVFDEAPRRRGRLLAGALLFVAGFTFVFVSAGVLLGGLGGFLLENQEVLQRWLGGATIVLGLAFIGFVPWMQRDVRLDRPRSAWPAPRCSELCSGSAGPRASGRRSAP